MNALMVKSANTEGLKPLTERFLGSSPSESTGGIMSKQDKITHAVYFTLHAITIAILLIK